MHHETFGYGIGPFHQLSVAYCLRAFCTSEAEPNSKVLMQNFAYVIYAFMTLIIRDFLY